MGDIVDTPKNAAWVIPIDPGVLVSSIEAYGSAKHTHLVLQSCMNDENNRFSKLPTEIVFMIEDEMCQNTTLQERTEMFECAAHRCSHLHTYKRNPHRQVVPGCENGSCSDCRKHFETDRHFTYRHHFVLSNSSRELYENLDPEAGEVSESSRSIA